MSGDLDLKTLLARCTARLDTDRGPAGTAFFVAPDYAVTAAHVLRGAPGMTVSLHSPPGSWRGHIEDARPPAIAVSSSGQPYPPPDVALIRIDDGPEHLCALLADHVPPDRTAVSVRGHTETFDNVSVSAETESFELTGELETPDPGCTLLKLGHGQAARGMSGAPVLVQRTGEVIGMLRTSRQARSNLGAWVVPTGVICRLWPRQVRLHDDRLQRHYELWRGAARRGVSDADPAPGAGGMIVGTVHGDVGFIMSGGNAGVVNVTTGTPAHRRRGDSRRGGQ
jgi:hypothetical protein